MINWIEFRKVVNKENSEKKLPSQLMKKKIIEKVTQPTLLANHAGGLSETLGEERVSLVISRSPSLRGCRTSPPPSPPPLVCNRTCYDIEYVRRVTLQNFIYFVSFIYHFLHFFLQKKTRVTLQNILHVWCYRICYTCGVTEYVTRVVLQNM